jgi:multidrug resistance protein, MATE family
MKLSSEEIKRTLNLAYPVIVGQLGFVMMWVVDSLMVGEIGATPLAASTVSNSVIMLVYIIGIGVTFSITPLVAIAVGGNQKEECGIIFRQSLLVCGVMGILLMLIALFIIQYLYLLNQPEEVLEAAIPYSTLIAISIVPMLIFSANKQFIEGLSVMRPGMIIVLSANLINWFCNWLLIYGNWGLPRLELTGAGWATFISRIYMAAVMLIFLIRSNRFRKYNVNFKYQGINLPVIKRLLKLGLPSGVQYFFEVGAFSFAVIMVGWLGTIELAAHQIAINLSSISFMCAIGLSTAGGIMVGNGVGKKDIVETRRAGFTSIILAAGIMMIFGLLFILLRGWLPTLYIEDSDVIGIASTLLIIVALFQVSDGVQAVGIGILRGLTDVKGPTIITFVSYWIIGLPIGYLLGFMMEWGVVGVWIGLLIGLGVSSSLLTMRFNKKSKYAVNI